MHEISQHRHTVRRMTGLAIPTALLVAIAMTLAGCEEASPEASPLNCSYPSAADRARSVDKPTNLDVPTTGELGLELRTTAGLIDITLSREQAPCAVHSFANLLNQSYFVNTPCHRLTAPPAAIAVLQCGDPTGTGAGGPGYVVTDEQPTGLAKAKPEDPESTVLIYPRGTIALANRGVPDSGGSQFFLVYADSPLAPEYSVLGTVDDASLPQLDAIAAAGTDGSAGPGDGRPVMQVTIKAIDRRDG